MNKHKLDISEDSLFNLNFVQKLIREKICSPHLPDKLLGLDKQKQNLFDIIKRTALIGESNSLLLIGPRGSGKSMLLQIVLQDLDKMKDVKANLVKVFLNGIIHTDDRIALKEITKQLQLESETTAKVFVSFAENLSFLLEVLKSGDQSNKSVLFVLDEFDLFAHHKNQTLLYNLFDASQSANTPIIVIGLTCRLDVIELLEKRVKSRFSHRQFHFLNDYTFEDYSDLFKSILLLPNVYKNKKIVHNWNMRLEDLCKNSVVIAILQKQYNITKEIRNLHAFILLLLTKLNENHPQFEVADFIEVQKLLLIDSKACLLQGLSLLELALIIAMNHLTLIYSEPFNFEMVYNVYQKFAQKSSSVQYFEKPVILKAYEHLQAIELIQPVSTAARIQKEYRLMNLLVDSSQIIDTLQMYPNLPVEVKQWATRQLI